MPPWSPSTNRPPRAAGGRGGADGEGAAVTERQGRGDHRRRAGDRQGDGDGAGAKGCRVAIGDLDLALAEQTAAGLGGGTVALPLDVTDRGSFERFLDEAERQLGPLDVVINNAGIMPVTPFVEESEDSFRRQIEINLSA